MGAVDLVDLLEEYLGQAMDAAEDGSTYPLFDDLTGNFVAEAVRYGLMTVSEAAEQRGRYGGLTGDLLRRLPTFEDASLVEILDVRRDLEGPCAVFGTPLRTTRGRSARLLGSPALSSRRTSCFERRSSWRSPVSSRLCGRTARLRSWVGGLCDTVPPVRPLAP